jgi:nuclear transcription factor Y alpha
MVHQPYLHESRHKHAMRRPRGPGGRFLTAEEIAAQKSSKGGLAGVVHSPSNDNEDDGDDDEAPPIVFDDNHSLPRDPYQDAGSLANALSSNPRQHIRQSQSQQMSYVTNLSASNTPMAMQSSYPTMQQMHPQPQVSMHYSNGLYSNTDGVSDPEMRRQTEEMIHFGARGGGSGSS